MQRGILHRVKSDLYILVVAATRDFTMVSFTEAVSHQSTFVRGICAPPSALLVFLFFRTLSQKTAEPIIAKLEHKMYPMPRVLGKKVKLFQFHVRY